MDYNIMLIGFMGTGKSTVSKVMSSKLHIQETDMDDYIVEYAGMSINDIFSKYGEERFRDIESECVKELCETSGKIISCGGGAVLRDENVTCMKKNGLIVLLTATARTVYERVKDSTDRPVLNGNMNVEYITELMNRRRDRYLEVADIIICTDDKTPEDIVSEMIEEIQKYKK